MDGIEYRMTNLGFDVRAIIRGLEDWLLENHAQPINPEGAAWPAARSACVLELAFVHCGEHGVPAAGTVNGCPAHIGRCSDWPCEVAAVSFALFELHRFASEASSPEVATLRRLERVVRTLNDSSSALRERLFAAIEAIRDGLRSPAFRDEFTGGRPRMRLTQAITHHLHRGGFSHRQVAAFTGTEGETARKRSKAEDSRSIVPFEDCVT